MASTSLADRLTKLEADRRKPGPPGQKGDRGTSGIIGPMGAVGSSGRKGDTGMIQLVFSWVSGIEKESCR